MVFDTSRGNKYEFVRHRNINQHYIINGGGKNMNLLDSLTQLLEVGGLQGDHQLSENNLAKGYFVTGSQHWGLRLKPSCIIADRCNLEIIHKVYNEQIDVYRLIYFDSRNKQLLNVAIFYYKYWRSPRGHQTIGLTQTSGTKTSGLLLPLHIEQC